MATMSSRPGLDVQDIRTRWPVLFFLVEFVYPWIYSLVHLRRQIPNSACNLLRYVRTRSSSVLLFVLTCLQKHSAVLMWSVSALYRWQDHVFTDDFLNMDLWEQRSRASIVRLRPHSGVFLDLYLHIWLCSCSGQGFSSSPLPTLYSLGQSVFVIKWHFSLCPDAVSDRCSCMP